MRYWQVELKNYYEMNRMNVQEIRMEIEQIKQQVYNAQEQWQKLLKVKRSIMQTEKFIERIEKNFEAIKQQVVNEKIDKNELKKMLTYTNVLEKKVASLLEIVGDLIKNKRLRAIS